MPPRMGGGALLQHCIAPEIRFERCASQKKAGVSWPLDDAVTNEMLKRILFSERATAETLHTQPDCPYIHKELARPGVNLTLLWTEYCRCCKNSDTTPYMYTQFSEKYQRGHGSRKPPCESSTNPEMPCRWIESAARWISMTRLALTVTDRLCRRFALLCIFSLS